jgi:hypothetical protein
VQKLSWNALHHALANTQLDEQAPGYPSQNGRCIIWSVLQITAHNGAALIDGTGHWPTHSVAAAAPASVDATFVTLCLALSQL